MQINFLRALSACVLACASALALTACGGGGGGGSGSGGTSWGAGGGSSAPTVSKVTFHPISLDVAPGGKIYLRADATMSDGSSFEITTVASWTSSMPAVATVGSTTGIVEGVKEGSTDVTVTYGGVSAVAHVRVGIYLVALEVITAQRLGIGVGATFDFTATGQFTDGARDATQLADWSSSDSSILKISNASDSKAHATALMPGEVTVTTASNGIQTKTYVEVLPIQSLAEFRDVGSCNPVLGVLNVDASGKALSMWSCPFASAGDGDLWWSATRPGTTSWSTAEPLRRVNQRVFAQQIKTASNDNGTVVAAWAQTDGVYAALYSPATGWQAPTQIAPQSPASPNEQIFVGIDAKGNALAFWQAGSNKSRRYDSVSGRWDAPVDVPFLGAERCSTRLASFGMSSGGQASLVWESFNCHTQAGESAVEGIYAARWQSGTGWQAAEQVASDPNNLISDVAAAINDAGGITVAWFDYPPATEANSTPFLSPQRAFSRSYTPDGGWGATLAVASDLKRLPRHPKMGANIHGGAVLSWENAYDYSVSAALLDPIKGWGGPVDVLAPERVSDYGDATPMTPYLLDDGRALVPWQSPFLGLGQFALSRYTPGPGWVFERLAYVGRRGNVSAIDIRFNRKGQGAIAWTEGTSAVTNFYVKSGLSF